MMKLYLKGILGQFFLKYPHMPLQTITYKDWIVDDRFWAASHSAVCDTTSYVYIYM